MAKPAYKIFLNQKQKAVKVILISINASSYLVISLKTFDISVDARL